MVSRTQRLEYQELRHATSLGSSTSVLVSRAKEKKNPRSLLVAFHPARINYVK